jgi:hypothetical protein
VAGPRFKIVPVELAQANRVVALWHRHHKPVQGHRFSLGVVDETGVLRGVAVVGRPVARNTPPDRVVEVTRCCTDGTPNACSCLYAAAARVAQALGFERIQTFTLDSEGGASLRAAGWTLAGVSPGGQWRHSDGKPRRTDQPTCPKKRWERILNPRVVWTMPDADGAPSDGLPLWKEATTEVAPANR